MNEALEKRPNLINRDPYDSGWMVRLQPDDWPETRERFLTGEPALAAIAERMRLDNFDPARGEVQALQWK